uniref:Uncharacterized protein n=1 Tax=Chromera velia CCMP2878 TaxID=1169474 RepID=A0A0G4HC13_9ALVE|eukprot:Cvel_26081.t1-p1 / transcript=Cvel_26081.t1 / gene=Cvel_26081 / organism=Chromera_velia_CCMP2878 / gene_product=hypothetical protein / transcript_product=hypothetical protein / location=Cvel_scaffold3046:1890-2480(+) / protein_length=197 / sequence_SO=supercontig / SO=protein_coding / is_pseudo=false
MVGEERPGRRGRTSVVCPSFSHLHVLESRFGSVCSRDRLEGDRLQDRSPFGGCSGCRTGGADHEKKISIRSRQPAGHATTLRRDGGGQHAGEKQADENSVHHPHVPPASPSRSVVPSGASSASPGSSAPPRTPFAAATPWTSTSTAPWTGTTTGQSWTAPADREGRNNEPSRTKADGKSRFVFGRTPFSRLRKGYCN